MRERTINMFEMRGPEELAIAPLYRLQLVRERDVPYREKIDGASNVYELCEAIGMHELTQEALYAFYLDVKLKVIGMVQVSLGTLNSSLLHAREVYKGAVLHNAHAVILAHNHPSGDTTPSGADRSVTKDLVAAGKTMGIELLDHIIVGDKGFHSMREQGELR